MGDILKMVRLQGRDADIAKKASEISGKKELIDALTGAIKILKGTSVEQRADSDMADMENLLTRFSAQGSPS